MVYNGMPNTGITLVEKSNKPKRLRYPDVNVAAKNTPAQRAARRAGAGPMSMRWARPAYSADVLLYQTDVTDPQLL